MTDIINVPIRNCGFSTRLGNVLYYGGYIMTYDLFKKPMEELLYEIRYLPNCGKKSEQELKEWMYQIHSLNCSNFKKDVSQLVYLYDIQAQVNNLIIQKQKQMDDLLSEIEPNAYYYADAVVSLAKKRGQRL